MQPPDRTKNPPNTTPINLPFHLFRPQPAPTQRDSETIQIATTADVNWNRSVFRAPSLPTHHQFSRALPFFVNFQAKERRECQSA
ncbi:MAG: hypothetical protein CK548_05750 [Opitutia bacterium]|nr:MAG: hypothetical protein CK548_05750 [Opitutae bacterium]